MFVPASPGQVKQARHSCPPTRSSAENTWRSESPARRDVLAFLEGEFPERRAPSRRADEETSFPEFHTAWFQGTEVGGGTLRERG